MNITLKNNLIEKALGLREEVFHFYISLVFVLKEGTHAKSSIQYGISKKALYNLLKAHLGYNKTFRTFQRNYGQLLKLELIKGGFHKTNFIDIIHRSEKYCPIKRNFWSDIDSELLKHLIFDNSGNELKVILKDRILGEEKSKSVKEKSKRYLKKVYKISNQKTLFLIQSDTFGTPSRKDCESPPTIVVNEMKGLSDAVSETLIEPIDTLASNNINTSVERKKASPSIDFKKLKMDLKSINTINKIRRSKGRDVLSRIQIQESINQFSYAVDNKLVDVSNPTKFLAYNLQHYGIFVLQDQYISDYQYFKSTGEARKNFSENELSEARKIADDYIQKNDLKLTFVTSAGSYKQKTKVSSAEQAYKDFLKLNCSSDEEARGHRRLIAKTPLFTSFEKMSDDLKIKSNYFEYLLRELI